MANKYLDSTGVKYLWDKIKSTYQPKGNYLSVANINGKYFDTRTYINHHPENGNGSIIPFIYNDLGHLLSKGGICSIYTTSSTSYTADSLTAVKTVSATANLFDGSPSYQSNFSSILTAQTSGDTSLAQETLVIDVTCHKLFSYSNTVYIDFGNLSWYCQNIQILTKNDSATTYTSRANVTGHTQPAYYASFDIGSAGFNKLRIVLKNPKRNLRIAQIGVINYGSSGVNETFVSRAGTSMYGSLYPYVNKGANLGTSNNMWANIYGGTIYENGTSLSSKYLQSIPTATSSVLGGIKIGYTAGTTAGSSMQRPVQLDSNNKAYVEISKQNIVDVVGEASDKGRGLMSATDKLNLDIIVNSFNSDDADATIETVKEVLKVFESYPAGTSLANALAGKLDKSGGTITGVTAFDTTSNTSMTTPALNILHTGPKDAYSYADLMTLSGFKGGPYGFKFRTYGDGTAIIQSQRISNDGEVFPLSLNPNGGNVLMNGKLIATQEWVENKGYVSTNVIKISLTAEHGTLSEANRVTLVTRPHQVVFEYGGYYYFAENLSDSNTWYYSCNVYYSGSQIIKRVIAINKLRGDYSKNDYTYTPPSYTLPTDPTFNSISLVSSDGNYTSTLTRKNRLYTELNSSLSVQGHGYFYGNLFITGDLTLKDYNNTIQNSDGKTLLKSVNSTQFNIGNTSLAVDIYGNRTYLYYNDRPLATLGDTIKSVGDFNFDSGYTSIDYLDERGIGCYMSEIEIEINDGDDYHYCTGSYNIPIVAGNGITITKNDNNLAVISSTASGGAGGGLKLIDSGVMNQYRVTVSNIEADKTYMVSLKMPFMEPYIKTNTAIIHTNTDLANNCHGGGSLIWYDEAGHRIQSEISLYTRDGVDYMSLYPDDSYSSDILYFGDDVTYEIYELGGGSGGNELLVVENTAEAIEAAGGFGYLLNKYSLVAFEVEAYGKIKQSQFFKIDKGNPDHLQFDFFFFQNNMSEETSTHTWLLAEIISDNDTAILSDWSQVGDFVGYSPETNCILNILFM